MGGTLDATNILSPPLVCVLCRIAVDHVEFLGSSAKEIAPHKAGIIKAGVSAVVIGLQAHQDATQIFLEKAASCAIDRVVLCSSPAELIDEVNYTVKIEFPLGSWMEVSRLSYY